MSRDPLGPRRVRVRHAGPGDATAWLELRDALWPGDRHDHAVEIEAYFADPPDDAICLLAAVDGVPKGFAEVGLRAYAAGCRSSPVGYLEGIYVTDDARRSGVARRLVAAAEEWARERRCTEMASDREVDNEVSGDFHLAVGFDEVERVVCYRKLLSDGRSAQASGVPERHG